MSNALAMIVRGLRRQPRRGLLHLLPRHVRRGRRVAVAVAGDRMVAVVAVAVVSVRVDARLHALSRHVRAGAIANASARSTRRRLRRASARPLQVSAVPEASGATSVATKRA